MKVNKNLLYYDEKINSYVEGRSLKELKDKLIEEKNYLINFYENNFKDLYHEGFDFLGYINKLKNYTPKINKEEIYHV